jgi:hypothetical protein
MSSGSRTLLLLFFSSEFAFVKGTNEFTPQQSRTPHNNLISQRLVFLDAEFVVELF